jgi:hypothetical protein
MTIAKATAAEALRTEKKKIFLTVDIGSEV